MDYKVEVRTTYGSSYDLGPYEVKEYTVPHLLLSDLLDKVLDQHLEPGAHCPNLRITVTQVGRESED